MSLSQTQLFPIKYVTIATDISADFEYQVCTWACYIRWGGGVIKRSGEFKEWPGTTLNAETLALCNALVIAANQIPDWDESRVIIHNEIENVLEPLQSKHQKTRDRDAIRANAIVTVALPILDKCASYDRRKIKAHFKNWEKSDNPKKYYMNRWCDKESRSLMKSIRKVKRKDAKMLALTS